MTAQAVYVRTIQRAEKIKDLVNETKARAWVSDAEYAIVRLGNGERVMVSGGPGGIEFMLNREETEVIMLFQGARVQVKRVYFHTHPRVTGPSEGDLRVLRILGQRRSYIFELGGDPRGTLIRPK
jgi:hypothetical protein